MADEPIRSDDAMPVASSRGVGLLSGAGPWWLAGSRPRLHGPTYDLPPTLMTLGALGSVFLGLLMAGITVSGSPCDPPPPGPTFAELLGIHAAASAAVVAARVRTSRRFRPVLFLPAAVLLVTTIVGWIHPRGHELADHRAWVVVLRAAGGLVTGFGVYALTHVFDARKALGRALAFVIFAPFAIGLAATLVQRLVPFAGYDTGLIAFGVGTGVGTAVAWALATRATAAATTPTRRLRGVGA